MTSVYHCFKYQYQTLEVPDGECFDVWIMWLISLSDIFLLRLIVHCSGCADGRGGDEYILRQSNLLSFLRARRKIMDTQSVFFGDSAYPNTAAMISMFRDRNFSEWATTFNKVLATVRISVEWGYTQVCNNFAYVDWNRQSKIEADA